MPSGTTKEGLFVEPASAVALAGLRALAAREALPSGARVVIIATSSGLKNLDAARGGRNPRRSLPRSP